MIPLKPLEKELADFDESLQGLKTDSQLFNVVNESKKGTPNLYKLIQMDIETIRKALKENIGDELPNHFIDNASITKEIQNDIPNSITLCFYDRVEINNYIIKFIAEHGKSRDVIKTHFLKL